MFGRKYQFNVRNASAANPHLASQQLWSTYALHIATFTSLSFIFDPLILGLLYKVTEDWTPDNRFYAFAAQLTFMAITKAVKLIGLFVREPSDLMYLPVSILFGYFHGLVKMYALFTLRIVSHVPACLLRPPLTDFVKDLLGQSRRR
jgi:hypothetical protein